ncbi:alpha/beta hydrolase family protein [Roseicyclus sp. F158]|uniref:Alpha/beta hydrolase family protein n=1 Tax=Tropicimonas omnivorans TaxID=3075590 RepID=A0ABU3DGX9_9RHOB|nr:alpha/beta hydrolase family protein [Roseicyclus sp. F158]MDT0682970.1 alpha/beta hydrolase family protein [Roseicyclus sp. F158]
MPDALPPFLSARRADPDLDLGWQDESFGAWWTRLLGAWQSTLPPTGITGAARNGDTLRLTHATGAVTRGLLTCPPGPGPHPAVILFHEHGGRFDIGWEKLHDLPASKETRDALYGGHSAALAMQAAGLATLSCDAPCFGSRQAGGYDGQQAFAAAAMGLGWSLAGLAASEHVALADWLTEDPRIGRIGAFGFSMGGHAAWVAGALSPRIEAVASASWLACRADLMAPGMPLRSGHSAFHFLHPGLSHRADYPDLAGLAAGKPLFFRSGRGDRHMPQDSVRRAWSHVARIAQAAGGPAPDTAFHPHGHTCPPDVLEAAASFLAAHLAGPRT